jgi:hypothetical protein
VVNFGIGSELFINKAVSAYGSIFIDNNALDSRTVISLYNTEKHGYHITTGANILIGATYVTGGLEFAHGKSDILFNENLEYPEASEGIKKLITSTKVQLRQIKIKAIISAAFSL